MRKPSVIKMTEWIAIFHLKKKAYLIDRQAYFLLCRMQEIKFGHEEAFDRDIQKERMYGFLVDWLINNERAIILENSPHHLIIRFEDDD